MPSERRPDLFIVGAQKSGTSTLASWLRDHSRAFMSYPKEPGFIAFGEQGYRYLDGYGQPAPASGWVVNDASEYMALFQEATEQHKIIGEASTWYLAIPGTAKKIRQFNPAAKIVIVLRNPVDRAYSAWAHARRDGLEPLADFKMALAAEADRVEPEFLLRYHAMGEYSEQVAAYFREFSQDHILVTLFDDLSSDAEQLRLQLYNFLGLSLEKQASGSRRYNRSGVPRSRLLQSLFLSHRFKVFWRRLLPGTTAAWIKVQLDRVNLQRLEPMDPAVRRYLINYYRADINSLMALTGRDLSHWLV